MKKSWAIEIQEGKRSEVILSNFKINLSFQNNGSNVKCGKWIVLEVQNVL